MSADPTENDSQGPDQELSPVDSEVTPVGGTSKKLLELSEGGDQNTRAYRAPRELLDLARRQRALGFRPSQSVEARLSSAPPVPVQSVPPEPMASKPAASSQKGSSQSAPVVPSKLVVSSHRQPGPRSSSQQSSGSKPAGHQSPSPSDGDKDSADAASSQKRRVRPVSLSPSDFSEGEAAPPRPIAESVGPRDRPTRRPGRSEESVESSAPSISYQPASSRSAHSVEALEAPATSAHDDEEDVDAAPPVARSRPSRALSSEPSSPSPGRPAATLSELIEATSDRGAAASLPAPSPRIPANDLDAPSPSSLSSNATTLRNRGYLWAFLFVVFIVVGFLLARWRVLDLVLPPH